MPIVDIARLRSRYRGRSARFRLDGSDTAAALADAEVRLGGWNAAVSYDNLLDDDRSQSNVVYIGADSYGPWLERHWLVPSSSPRLLVHVVNDEIAGTLHNHHRRYVPARAAAVDLTELGGVRPSEAALRIWNR